MPKTVFHATRAEFAAFDMDRAGRGEGHLNSTLGIWFATTHDWLTSYGHRILEVEVELGRSYPMEVGQLARTGRDFEKAVAAGLPPGCSDADLDEAIRNSWLDLRQRLLTEGYDSIDVVENDGRVAMHVVLRTDCISGFREMTSTPAPRQA